MTDFVSGRLSYDKLSKQLRSAAASSQDMLKSAHQTIRSYVDDGRLPEDLGQILLNQLPDRPADVAEDAAQSQSDASSADEFDEPTLPQSVPAAAFDSVPSEQATPAGQLPPLPFLDNPAHPEGGEARAKVDDAVLSSLVSGFSDFRSRRSTPDLPAAAQPDDGKLDRFLTDFKSVRFRSDARRAAGGQTSEGLDLNKVTAANVKRATVGSILRDRFILDSEIGRGGMGYVYSAVDRRRLEAGHDQPYVAIKLLNESFQNDAEALRLLEAEARKSQALAHPNITTVYDFDRDRADVFIVMELLQGTGLDRRIGRSLGQPLPMGECAKILKGTCAGLSYAHSREVVHSDLKPGNIYILNDGTIKLLDFGLAAAAIASADHPIQDSLTAAYASPEQFERAPRDPRDDVFALGCIAYQILTGTHPFSSRPTSEAAKAGLAPAVIDGLEPEGWETIRRALEFDRDQRLPDVDSFLAGLFDEDSRS